MSALKDFFMRDVLWKFRCWRQQLFQNKNKIPALISGFSNISKLRNLTVGAIINNPSFKTGKKLFGTQVFFRILIKSFYKVFNKHAFVGHRFHGTWFRKVLFIYRKLLYGFVACGIFSYYNENIFCNPTGNEKLPSAFIWTGILFTLTFFRFPLRWSYPTQRFEASGLVR